MNPNKLLQRIIRRQVEAIAQTINEAELAGDITPTDAQSLRGDAERILAMMFSGKSFDRSKSKSEQTADNNGGEKAIMELVAEVLGEVGMEQCGGTWRVCIRGGHGHPPRPGKVRRVFEAMRSELAGGKVFDNRCKYAWWLYKEFAD